MKHFWQEYFTSVDVILVPKRHIKQVVLPRVCSDSTVKCLCCKRYYIIAKQTME